MSRIDTSLSLCIIQYVLVGAKWQGCINAGTVCFRDDSSRGPGVSEHSYVDTSFRDLPSPHRSNSGEMNWPGGDRYIGDWEDDKRLQFHPNNFHHYVIDPIDL